MRLSAAALIVLAAAALGACAPQPASQQAAAAPARRAYQEPTTGSLFGGVDDQNLSNGYHDPGMGNHQSTAGGN